MAGEDIPVDKVLEYLNVWRSRRAIESRFKFSVIQTQHLLKWLEKGRFIDLVEVRKENWPGRITLYKKKK